MEIFSFNIQHFVLAYLGMALHMLVKIEEARKKQELTDLKTWVKDNLITTIVSVIMVPLILIVAETDPLIKQYLPINNLTSIFAGWQTESLFKTLMGLVEARLPKKEEVL